MAQQRVRERLVNAFAAMLASADEEDIEQAGAELAQVKLSGREVALLAVKTAEKALKQQEVER
jgi:hypothetical protein